jgi:hypothetical protein
MAAKFHRLVYHPAVVLQITLRAAGRFMSLSGMVEIPRPFDCAQGMLQGK